MAEAEGGDSPRNPPEDPARKAPAAAGPGLALPQKAAIYIDVDGTVHFGALFEGLVPVAKALGAKDEGDEGSEGGDP